MIECSTTKNGHENSTLSVIDFHCKSDPAAFLNLINLSVNPIFKAPIATDKNQYYYSIPRITTQNLMEMAKLFKWAHPSSNKEYCLSYQ